MPAGDRTGPWGLGPMTGRAMGYCTGFPLPGFANPRWRGWGRGFGRGGGRGRGLRGFGIWGPWGAGFPAYTPPLYVPPPKTQLSPGWEVDVLKEQAAYFEKTLKDLRERIQELESGQK